MPFEVLRRPKEASRWRITCTGSAPSVSYVKAQHDDELDRVIKQATIVDPSASGAAQAAARRACHWSSRTGR
jgi:hypothetical protein